MAMQRSHRHDRIPLPAGAPRRVDRAFHKAMVVARHALTVVEEGAAPVDVSCDGTTGAPHLLARYDPDAAGRPRRTRQPSAQLRALDHLSEAEQLLALIGSVAGVDRRSAVRREPSTGGELLRLARATHWRLDQLELAYRSADWALRLQIRRVVVGSGRRSQPSVMALLSRAASELSEAAATHVEPSPG
jgi:hypothetical protein